VTSAEILYGNVLTFDFCCMSRCSGEMLLTEASPCFSAFIHVICLGHYLSSLYSDSGTQPDNDPAANGRHVPWATFVAANKDTYGPIDVTQLRNTVFLRIFLEQGYYLLCINEFKPEIEVLHRSGVPVADDVDFLAFCQ
jgi:hypothetical protein